MMFTIVSLLALGQGYQPPPDKDRFPSVGYVTDAIIAGRWDRAKELLNEIGSFKNPKYAGMRSGVIGRLCEYAGASDRYANALTGIRLLFERGADPAGNRNIAIAYVIGKDQWGEIIERLIQYGVKPDALTFAGPDDRTGCYPMFLSILYNPKAKAAEVLLKHGADPNRLNDAPYYDKLDGESSLSYLTIATIEGKTDFVRVLLKYKAKVNMTCPDNGMSALHYAAKWNRTEIIPMLLKAGANKRAKDKQGRTPLQIAKASKSMGAIKLLS